MSEQKKRNPNVLYDPETDGTGRYCCAICLYWYETREQKDECMRVNHGYETINISPTKQ